MPESLHYVCEVCGASVDDADLEADTTGTLRRVIVNAQAFKAVTTTDPTSQASSTSIEEKNPGNPLVFCGQAHAAQWATNWVW